jgi:hypothetical protein
MYNIVKGPSSGSYLFQTENGLLYVCRFQNCTREFSPVLGIYDIEVFEFDFTCHSLDAQNCAFKKFDKKVSATISYLLLKFFTNELRIIIYVCDTADGRHRERHKLFKIWFNNLEKQEDFTRIPMELDQENKDSGLAASAHGCIITRKDFPHPEVLQRELIDKAASIIGQKLVATNLANPTSST